MSVTRRLEAKVRQDFEPGSVDLMLVRLAKLRLPGVESDTGRERVQAAVVLVAAGRWSRFEREAADAEADWRDVLVSAGLADDDWRVRLDERLGPSQAS